MTGVMRRPLRILFSAATMLSLLLCVATVGLWVRSSSHFDSYYIVSADHGRCRGISSRRGEVWLFDVRTPDGAPLPQPGWQLLPLSAPRPWWWGYTAFDRVNRGGHVVARAQYWRYRSLVLLTIALPAVLLVRQAMMWQRARNDRQNGRCLACGYDLRATPDRCPECGTTVVTPATPAREGKGETEGV